jgi:prolyl-tRNA editing enzyme YbaK/EbsC (Cys-tRNA(Pro) deacylase)
MPSLELSPALERPELLAAPVVAALRDLAPGLAARVAVAPIDGTRGETTRYAACIVLATTRLDVSGVVRRLLDARKASFAPVDDAVALSGMEYGGITPVGLPPEWDLYLDARVATLPSAIVGSGIRGSKLQLPGEVLAALPGAVVIDGLARDSSPAG